VTLVGKRRLSGSDACREVMLVGKRRSAASASRM
jgi:hypothetical protein